MARDYHVTIDGTTITARRGELVLDAALRNGIDLPHDCRAGHCGSCCVRLVSGQVGGGHGAEPGIVHACQCKIAGDAEFARHQPSSVRTVKGTVGSLRFVAPDIVEVVIKTSRALPHRAGQYAKVRFEGYPDRSFSLTHPLEGSPGPRSICFHIRRMEGGRVTPALGQRIRDGHRVEITGPFGSAYFRPNLPGRVILVGTNTGFAPIWSIAASALRENPYRQLVIIVGGKSLEALYMAPALYQLSRFPNVHITPVCSTPQNLTQSVRFGRPTDYLPQLFPDDVLYACGAPAMVGAIQAIAVRAGAVCYADPFQPTASKKEPDRALVSQAGGWLHSLSPANFNRPSKALPSRRPQQARALIAHHGR